MSSEGKKKAEGAEGANTNSRLAIHNSQLTYHVPLIPSLLTPHSSPLKKGLHGDLEVWDDR
ncbi:hypothetical protein [Scytonema millei]|uniref:Uncharacterized protein n=1 Tax=Scytonema millei VB511283 TaxID=1245923 RepID=A0A9X5I645_9CYAN|nr:hypothetical protein [Scytonema millei]NHC36765.1 hypothetical protein [Scytonema millei VB511283]